MAKKSTETKKPENIEDVLGITPVAPDNRRTDDELPVEAAATAIKEAAGSRQRSRKMTASVEIQKSTTFDLYEKVLEGTEMDFDRERRGRSESRAQAAGRLAVERNLEWDRDVKRQDHDVYQYALSCPHCAAPGVFFEKNPLGRVLYHDDWFSALKPRGESWHMDMLPCQQCFIDRGMYMAMSVNEAVSGDSKRGKAFSLSGALSRLVVKFAKDPSRREQEGILDAVMDRTRTIGAKSKEEEARNNA